MVNFKKMCDQWFGKSLDAYNFAVLPLSFDYDFQELSTLDLSTMPDGKANLIRNVIDGLETTGDAENLFIYEVQTRLVSAKNSSEDFDIAAGITSDSSESEASLHKRMRSRNEEYPNTWGEMQKIIEKADSRITRGVFIKTLKNYPIKDNLKYSTLNFTNFTHEKRHAKNPSYTTGSSWIYNGEAIRYISAKASEFVKQ